MKDGFPKSTTIFCRACYWTIFPGVKHFSQGHICPLVGYTVMCVNNIIHRLSDHWELRTNRTKNTTKTCFLLGYIRIFFLKGKISNHLILEVMGHSGSRLLGSLDFARWPTDSVLAWSLFKWSGWHLCTYIRNICERDGVGDEEGWGLGLF